MSACSTRRSPSWTRSRPAPSSLAELVEATGLLPGDGPPAGRRARGARPGAARRRRALRARRAADGAGPGRGRGDPARRGGRSRRCAALRDETGEIVQLYVRDGDRRVCIAALESPHGLRTIVPMGASLPLDAGLGRAGCSIGDESAPSRRRWVRERRRARGRGGVGERAGARRTGGAVGGGGERVGADRAHDPAARPPLRRRRGGAAARIEQAAGLRL